MKINIKPEQKVVVEVLKKNQKEFIIHFNKKGEGMISAPNIYGAANNTKFLENMRKEFEDNWLVTSTQIIYNKNNLKAKIIHHAGSKVKGFKPKEYKNILIPDYSGDFKEDKITEKYLQALFDTKHNIKKILKTLKKINRKKTICLWTPSQSSRRDKSIRSVDLSCFLGGFYVDGYDWFGNGDGCSHGVVINSEPKARGK